jgi:pyruvate kinase
MVVLGNRRMAPLSLRSMPERLQMRPAWCLYDATSMKISILCTLGPASLDPEIIRRLDERDVDLFRINLSHTPLEAVESTIDLVRRVSTTPICLDSEGPQVRCGIVESTVSLELDDRIRLTADVVRGTKSELTLWPGSVFEELREGNLVGIDFHGALLRITAVGRRHADAIVVAAGQIASNKAVTVDPRPALPALSDKDLAAIEIGARRGITHYALSFASGADDVARLRSLTPPDAHIIAKIESRAGVRNMDEIIEAADSVLIDRGDLSHEIALEYVPFYQKAVVRRANRGNRPVYVATNLLESMVTSNTPTIAEANDIANTLLDGVHGLVLAAETAVGIDPVGSVDIVLRIIRAFEESNDRQLLSEDRGRVDTRAAERPDATEAVAGEPGRS